MENPIYIALSRQDALRRQMDVTANNVANINTPGYKQQRMMFVEFLTRPANAAAGMGAGMGAGTLAGMGTYRRSEPLSMVKDIAVLRNLEDGPVNRTGNPLDVALDGRGYFTVETVDGPRYTRAGSFQLDPERRLVDVNGLPVLDEADRPIEFPQGAVDIQISGDGSVSTEQGPLGRIKVVGFEREQFMTELGGGLYTTDEPPIAADGVKLVQGAIEGSNVQGIVEMTQMTEILRQYQSNQRMIEAEHERQRNAIGRLTRVG